MAESPSAVPPYSADGRLLVIHYFTNGRGMNVELKFK
jgi:hypothetical protein